MEAVNQSITHPVVFFDGVCAMCNSTVNLIMRHDASGQIRFAPLQGTTAASLLGAEQAADMRSLVVIDGDGTWRKSTAVWRLLFRMGGWWKIAAALLWLIPYPIRDFGYSTIARYRYSLFGKRDSCRLRTEEERSRFLD